MTRERPIAVLVVDDDFRVAELHAQFVARVPGFVVVASAHTARGAVEAARSHRPDLVLLDLYLPDDSGLSVLRRLRDGPGPHPDVVVITAARDVPSLRSAMQWGVVHYLVKPFTFQLFADRLTGYRALWLQAQREGDVARQDDVDRLFGLLGRPLGTAQLPKGLSEPTMALIRAQFESADDDFSAADIAARTGVSRATAQRYLALLVQSQTLELTLRYGSAGRPEHRYKRSSR